MSNQTITIGQRIKNNTTDKDFRPYPNIDYIYGPYESVTDALSKIDKSKRNIFLTVGIKNLGEYWFVNGIEDTDFIWKCDKDFTKDINNIDNKFTSICLTHDKRIKDANKRIDDIISLTYKAHIRDILGSVQTHYFDLGLTSHYFKFSGHINESSTSTIIDNQEYNYSFEGTCSFYANGEITITAQCNQGGYIELIDKEDTQIKIYSDNNLFTETISVEEGDYVLKVHDSNLYRIDVEEERLYSEFKSFNNSFNQSFR